MVHPVHALNFALLAAAAAVLVLMALRIGLHGERSLLHLSLMLGVFSGVHSFYHLSEFLGQEYLADVILLPVSAGLFTVFAAYYWRRSGQYGPRS